MTRRQIQACLSAQDLTFARLTYDTGLRLELMSSLRPNYGYAISMVPEDTVHADTCRGQTADVPTARPTIRNA